MQKPCRKAGEISLNFSSDGREPGNSNSNEEGGKWGSDPDPVSFHRVIVVGTKNVGDSEVVQTMLSRGALGGREGIVGWESLSRIRNKDQQKQL